MLLTNQIVGLFKVCIDAHQSFLLFNTTIFCGCGQACPKTQNNKFAIYLQYLKGERKIFFGYVILSHFQLIYIICKEKIFHPSMALKTLLTTLFSAHLSLKSSLIIKPRLTYYFDVTVFKKHICIFN